MAQSTNPTEPSDMVTKAPVQEVEPTNTESTDLKAPAVYDRPHTDVRVAIVGNVDSGKSTLIGVLTNGGLDNGRGLARSKVFVHRHEAANGRTSCISQHILGFDEKGQIVHQTVAASASAAQKNKSWREVVGKSSSILTLIDLAGHERYLKTTIAGLTGCFPDYAVVVVGANMGITKMTKEHLGVAIALNIPILVCITKIDMCPSNVLQRTKKHLYKILKSQGAKKKPFEVKSAGDVQTCLKANSPKICPVFLMSAVTGENMDLLTSYLAGLKPLKQWVEKDKELRSEDVEFNIDETFVVTGVGLVLSGTVSKGIMEANSNLLLGPFSDGTFRPVLARTIHCKRTPVNSCQAGLSCAVALRSLNRKQPLRRSDIRRGMVIVHPSSVPKPIRKFEAEILVLHHPTTIKMAYQAVIHCGIVRQTASLRRMTHECLRTGDRARVQFEFMSRPEFIHPGQTLIFREGNTKGVGRVTRVFFDDAEAEAAAREAIAGMQHTTAT